MWILPLVGYAGAVIGFGFLTLAIASGLYYLSELVEEHTVLAKRFLSRLIQGIILLQAILLIVDRFPLWQTLLGIFAHVVYFGNMRRFPYVQLSDPLFLLSCVLVLLDHYVWFKYFSTTQQRAYQNMSSYYDTPPNVPTFMQIASYFGICVWLVPFALFVSLSASDNVLPTMGASETSGMGGGSSSTSKRGQGMAKALVDSALSIFGSVSSATGLKRAED
ncbi:erv26 superfamily protein [Sporothrix stenoceras]|uniref:Erv26 superfamily protein n=1 Tax=Sporothrix stenoceras TaxID=5173 RepID=A0ABR3YRN1_9PEZI